MIDMKSFLELMGAPTYTHQLSEDEMPAFMDNLIIDETGIRSKHVDKHTFQLLDHNERQQLLLDEDDARLDFPCDLAKFRHWIVNNGYEELVQWSDLKNDNEVIKTLAKIKGERLRIRMGDIGIDELNSKKVRPAHGNFEQLAEQYCWRFMLQQNIKLLDKDTKSSRSDIEKIKDKLILKIQEIDEATDAPLDPPKSVPANEKSKPPNRSSELHELIHVVDHHLQQRDGKKPTYKEVWNELEKNHATHDKLEIIEEITAREIIWLSSHRNRSVLQYSSFASALAKIRRKYSQ